MYSSNESNDIQFNTRARETQWSSIGAFCEELWLPLDWRNTVTDDYLSYQLYDSLQAIFSSIASMLADREMLVSLGVAKADASVDGALMLNIVSEAFSKTTSILFSWYFAKAFHAECKRYRFMADIFNDASLVLQTISSSISDISTRTCIVVLAAIMRALCGVCAGSAKASLTNHFAKVESAVPDINAKEGSQETVIYLIGLLIGTIVVRRIKDAGTVWALLALLVTMHLYANYRAVKSVCLKTLNAQRLAIVLDNVTPATVPTPGEVSSIEGILFSSAQLNVRAMAKPSRGQLMGCLLKSGEEICFEQDAATQDKLCDLIKVLRSDLDSNVLCTRLSSAGWDLKSDALGFDQITFQKKRKML